MVSLALILFVIALVDSTSMLPIGILPLAAILGGRRPVKIALSFISGIFLTYFVSGVLLLLGFDLIFEIIGPSISRWWHEPNTLELAFQIIVGMLLLAYAWKQYRVPKISAPSDLVGQVSLLGALIFTILSLCCLSLH